MSALVEENQEDLDDYLTNSNLYAEPQVHYVKCIDCEEEPIIGVRYHCQKCNADLCSKCEYNLNHLHILLKIRSPTQACGNHLVNQQCEAQNQNGSHLIKNVREFQEENESDMKNEEEKGGMLKFIKNKIKGQKIDLQCSIVSQNESSSSEILKKVLPNTIIQEKLILSNTGNQKWPSHCKFVQVSGNMKFSVQYVIPSLQPGGQTNVLLNITAPSKEGYYQSEFRLSTEENFKFGDNFVFKVCIYGNEIKEKVTKLVAMGFLDANQNLQLLEVYNGDFQQVVQFLQEQESEKQSSNLFQFAN